MTLEFKFNFFSSSCASNAFSTSEPEAINEILSSSDNFFKVLSNNALEDEINLFEKINHKNVERSNLSEKDRHALQILGLNYQANWADIQKKFKGLVKKYHPDKNRGSKKYEDLLKKITLAYSQLKIAINKKNDYKL